MLALVLRSVWLFLHSLELAGVSRRVVAHVDAICIRKYGLSLPLLAPEVPRNQLRQKIFIKVNAVEADFSSWKDQQFILGGCGYKR